MPVRLFSGTQAIRNLRSNPNGEWPSRDDADTNRIEPQCRPAFSPSFKLEYGEKIFTIGSCFARNIERALLARGFDVPTARIEWPRGLPGKLGPELLNSYGVASIANELRWALDPEAAFNPEKNVFQLTPNRYVDAHLPSLWPAAYDTVIRCREAVTTVTRAVVDCRVVVMTLGLSECWYDAVAGSYLNLSPPRTLVAKFPDRFELHVLNFDETLAQLRNAITTLHRFCRGDQRILLTVSPVPMKVTHTNQDVLVANTYSKAVLRTAAEHVAAEYDHIDYFPSYESIVLSDRRAAWMDDQIHPQLSMIALNVERMIEAYKPDAVTLGAVDVLGRLRDAEEEIEAANFEGAIRILEPLRETSLSNPDAISLYADLCIRLKRPKDARDAVALLPAGHGAWRRRLVEGCALMLEGNPEEACKALAALLEDEPRRPRVMRELIDAYCRLAQWEDAILVAKLWFEMPGNKSEALRRIAHIHAARGDAQQADAAFNAALNTRDAEKLSCRLLLDYADFLIGQKRLTDAARIMPHAHPDTPALTRRKQQLSIYLPTVEA